MRGLERIVIGVALVVAGAEASERSELLVARGEVAYHAGRLDEARRHFDAALADDPNDAIARGWLEVLAAGVPRAEARGGDPVGERARRWDLEIGTGVQYDSNPRLDPNGRRDDAAFLFTLAGHVDPWRDDRTLVRLDYDFFQSLHTQVDDFDVRSNRFRGTFARQVWADGLWLGVQGGYDHAVVDSHAYLQEPWVMPYVSYVEGDRGSTQLMYRHAEQDYLGQPFDAATLDRDGTLDTIGLNQLLFFFDRRLAVTLGYAWEDAEPHKASGNDYARDTHQLRAGMRFPAWWRTFVEFDYRFRYDDYSEPNTVVAGRKTRQDDGHYLATYLRRPILPHLDAVVSYLATINRSNIALFDYQRHIVAMELRYTF